MSAPGMAYVPLEPWTLTLRRQVEEVARHMAAPDRAEIFGLRDGGADAESVVADLGGIIRARRLIDGFVAFRMGDPDAVPVAVAFAWRSTMPQVAEIGMFGRAGEPRAIAEVYRELQARAGDLRGRGVVLAQVPIATAHRTACRRAVRSGGRCAFDYGRIGTTGQEYAHYVWRF